MASISIELAGKFFEVVNQYQEECEEDITIDQAGKALVSALASYIVTGGFRLTDLSSFEQFQAISDAREGWIDYFNDIVEIMYVQRSKQEKESE